MTSAGSPYWLTFITDLSVKCNGGVKVAIVDGKSETVAITPSHVDDGTEIT